MERKGNASVKAILTILVILLGIAAVMRFTGYGEQQKTELSKTGRSEADVTQKDGSTAHQTESDSDSQYFSMDGNYERDDLSYQLKWSTENAVIPSAGTFQLKFEYPQISGDSVKNIDDLNQALTEEYSAMGQYLQQSVAGYVQSGDEYDAVIEGMVTDMTEEHLSIVYKERITVNGEDAYYYLRCVNLDLNVGAVLTNTDLIRADENFITEFRKRSEKQNGYYAPLDQYSDSDLAKMFSSETYLILFYTPQGMEVGLNLQEGWITITLSDYQNYQNSL